MWGRCGVVRAAYPRGARVLGAGLGNWRGSGRAAYADAGNILDRSGAGPLRREGFGAGLGNWRGSGHGTQDIEGDFLIRSGADLRIARVWGGPRKLAGFGVVFLHSPPSGGRA